MVSRVLAMLCGLLLAASTFSQPFVLIATSGNSGGGGGGGDPPALVELKTKEQTASAVTSANVPITGVTAGNHIVVIFAVSAGGCSLSASSGTLSLAEDVYSTDWDVALAIWSAPNAGAGDHTITLTPCQQEFIRYAVIEFSGIATSNYVIDSASDPEGGLTSTIVVNDVTTGVDNTLLIGAVRTDGDETAHGDILVGSGYTLVYPFAAQEPEQKLMVEYAVVDAGTYGGTLFTTEQADGGGYTSALVAYASE